MTTAIAAEQVRTAAEPDGRGVGPAIPSAKESGWTGAETAIPSAKESAWAGAEAACAELERWGWPDDGKRYELVDGTPVELPPMRVSHGIVAGTMHRRFGSHIDQARLPYVTGVGTSFRLGISRANFRIPDVHVTALERMAIDLNDEPGVWEGYPDIAVEVVSPTDAYLDVVAKARLYLRQGVAAALLIDATHREVTVRQSDGAIRVLTRDDTLELGAALPGFSCRVADIFTDLDRMAARVAEMAGLATEMAGRTTETEGEVAGTFTDLDRMAARVAEMAGLATEMAGRTTETEGEVAGTFTDLDRMAGRTTRTEGLTAEAPAPTAETEGE